MEVHESWQEVGALKVSYGAAMHNGQRRAAVKLQSLREGEVKNWPESSREEVLAWIRHQAEALLKASHIDWHAEYDHPLDLEVVDLAVHPVEAAEAAGSHVLRVTGRLRFYHTFEPGDAATSFRVEFTLVHMDTQRGQVVAMDQAPVESGELARPVRGEFPVPVEGNYRLKAVVRLMPSGTVMAESQGPVVRVQH